MENDKKYMYAVVVITGKLVTVRAVCETQEKAQRFVDKLHACFDGLAKDDPLYGTTAHWERAEVV